MRGLEMKDYLNRDVCALKRWLDDAWRRISDPSMTAYERREIRNYMKEAETALRVGLKRIADQEAVKRETRKAILPNRRLEFRILQLDA
jgi:hypothetical protein